MTKLNFEQEILAGFERIGKSPRGDQVSYIDKVLSAYLVEGKTNVVLSAPTGTGKSIIGAVVADVLHEIMDIPERCASFILVGTNMLATQYAETFDGIRDFVQVKGANNYECRALSTSFVPEYADSCCSYDMKKSNKSELHQLVDKYCGKCEFAWIKKAKHVSRHVITNYSYFFIDRLFAAQHAYRTITVWDEAHTLNDAFAEHCSVYVSEKRLKAMVEEITEHLKIGDTEVFNIIKHFREDIKKGTITENNYLSKLKELHTVYKLIEEHAQKAAKSALSTDLKYYSKLSKLGKKYADMACKIGDLLAYEYEHIFELNAEQKEVSVKPIFVSDMFNQIRNSQFQLFMSATISDVMLFETLNLDRNDTAFIKLPPTFPIANKKVAFLGIDKLNYTTMKDENTRTKLKNACYKLVKKHSDEDESGIILTPSFDVTELVSKRLYDLDLIVFEHKRGEKLANLIEEYKAESRTKVMISPSMFEGLSLDDELSRYQIFVKCPYASLGEKRMKYIADKHPNMYQLSTLLKIVQGAGRSVRSAEDHAVTYFLDSMIGYLWKNKLNEWSDEFSISYQQLL